MYSASRERPSGVPFIDEPLDEFESDIPLVGGRTSGDLPGDSSLDEDELVDRTAKRALLVIKPRRVR